jgi:hypothetical protein
MLEPVILRLLRHSLRGRLLCFLRLGSPLLLPPRLRRCFRRSFEVHSFSLRLLPLVDTVRECLIVCLWYYVAY